MTDSPKRSGEPVEVKPGIWWVGAVDFDMRNIHGQMTDFGTSYNAYLIVDEHPTLIDTVKAPFADALLDNVAKIIDPAKVEYIVANHGELDHAGSLPRMCEAMPNATVYASAKGVKFLEGELGAGLTLPIVGVKTGDELNIGARTLSFVEINMVHWPDSMVTYCAADKVLFSNDAFGQHYGTEGRFDDEVPFDELMRQVAIYYANIVVPFSRMVAGALKKCATLDFDTIAPAHGVMWRSHIPEILAVYERYAAQEHGNDAVVVFDSMWESTEKMAHAVARGFGQAGVKAHIYDLKDGRYSDALADMLDAAYVAVGSPTRNSTMLPPVAYFLCELKGLFPKSDRKALAFGSYGWAPAGPKAVAAELEAAGYEQPFGIIAHNWVPNEADLDAIAAQVEEGVRALGAK